MALAFDTGKHARAIREGGVPAPAADAIVDAITEATDSLVTEEFLRNELARMEERITARMDMGIERLRSEQANQTAQLRTEMANLRAEMWRAMYLLFGTVTGVSIAIAGIALTIAELF